MSSNNNGSLHPEIPLPKWSKSLFVRIPGLFIGLLIALALSTFLAVNYFVLEKLESYAFETVEEAGRSIITVAQREFATTEVLTLALASYASTVELDTPDLQNKLRTIIDSLGSGEVIAGGGIWPEPYALDPAKERNCFFWGRDERGQLQFFDSYNDPDSNGYHQEEWYVPTKYVGENKVYWSRSYIDPYSDEPMTTCSAPIYKKGRFWGVATIDVKLSGISNIFQNFSSQFGGWAFVITVDGSILSFPKGFIYRTHQHSGSFTQIHDLSIIDPAFKPLAAQLKDLDETYFNQDQVLTQKVLELSQQLARESYQISESEAKLIALHILHEERNKEPQTLAQYLVKKDPIDHEEAVVTIQNIPDTHGKLISYFNYRELKSNIFGLYQMLSYLFLGLFGIALILCVFILNHTFLKPLTSIQSELKKAIEENSLIPSELSYNRRDEFGTLASLFNLRTRLLDKALKQLTIAKEHEQRANRAKSDFLATMTHEIRTPLHGISGYTNLLFDTHMNSEQEEYTRAIMANTDALMGVIDKILDFSKIESNKLDIEKHPFSIRKCLRDVTDLISPQADEKDLLYSVKISDKVPEKVIGDFQRLRQILLNLCSNAVKFTPKGFVRVELDAEYDQDSVILKFQISDSGIGIPEETIEKLFNPFTQADNSTTRRFGGSGLGLAISKRLIEAMGGAICLESKPGKGSTFAFNVKTGACTTHEILNDGAPSERLRDYSSLATECPLEILVAEDNPTNQKLINRILQKMGYQPDFADNGLQVLDRLKTTSYELILMDNLMPEMNGIDASLAIRKGNAGQEHRNVTIIAVTANAFKENKKQCLEAGMDGFLSKPVKISELAEVLQIAHNKLRS